MTSTQRPATDPASDPPTDPEAEPGSTTPAATTAATTAPTIRPFRTRPASARPTVADTTARRLLIGLLRHLRGGRLTVIEADSTVLVFGEPTDLDVTVRLRTPAVWRAVATQASAGLGETHMDGWWDTDDLCAFVRLAIRNLPNLDAIRGRWSRVATPVSERVRRLRRADLSRDRRNISAHYDLGNDFFELFLDESMTYSCGLFESEAAGLEEAQRRKYDRLCQLIELGPDDHLVEIGTGWGGLALHAASVYGARVTTCTISTEQHRLATELVERHGLSDRVEVVLCDYRDLTGTYDKLVSVEMIEAVDWRDHDAFFAACARLLRPDGQMALQAIVVPDWRYERAKTSQDFIKRFVFPGATIPSIEAITGGCARTGDLTLTRLDEFPRHYAETLARWRVNLDTNLDEARSRGYDDAFLRLWDFYLAYCEGAFRERYVSLVECVLVRSGYAPDRLEVRP